MVEEGDSRLVVDDERKRCRIFAGESLWRSCCELFLLRGISQGELIERTCFRFKGDKRVSNGVVGLDVIG